MLLLWLLLFPRGLTGVRARDEGGWDEVFACLGRTQRVGQPKKWRSGGWGPATSVWIRPLPVCLDASNVRKRVTGFVEVERKVKKRSRL